MTKYNNNNHKSIVEDQKEHFKNLYKKNRGEPDAVASETYKHKKLRYSKLIDLFPDESDFTVYEVGYGLGHFYEYLEQNFESKRFTYSGSEIVREYHEYCTETYDPVGEFELRNILQDPPSNKFDYVIMSGVFHQISDASKESWEEYMYNILKKSFSISTKGIAFNFLTEYVDYKNDGNYYVDISNMIRFSNEQLSRFFELQHDYPLFESTMYVYKPEFITEIYPQDAFQKYL